MEFSLLIRLKKGIKVGKVKEAGVYQSRIPVRGGIEYHGYLWIKTDDFTGRIRVALESDVTEGEIYAEDGIIEIRGDWQKYEFPLRATKSDSPARFCILFDDRAKLWLDQISLMPGDAVDGVRRDVFDRAKALKPSFIRYPGGNVAQDYHWQWGIGDATKDRLGLICSWNNEHESSDFGTDEFIRFARNVGAEPSITVNMEGRRATVEEAAAWVEYCNGATTKYGAMRGQNGHPAP